MNAAKGVTELCELAESYALNECGEWFQKEIVTKDMQNLKKRVTEFQKIVKETYARMQQAGVAYQDIGHVLGRYYDLNTNKGSDQQYQEKPGPQPLQETESMDSDETTQTGGKMADPMLPKGKKKRVTEAMDPERVAQLQKKFAAKPKPDRPENRTGVDTAVIQKFNSLPPDKKDIIKRAMKRPCAYCQGEFKDVLGGRSIGKSHGICRRHAIDQYKQLGKPLPADFQDGSVDIATLSDDEKKVLGYLHTIVKKRQTSKGVYEEDKDRPWIKDINRPWLPNG
jgi:hypothetical protein